MPVNFVPLMGGPVGHFMNIVTSGSKASESDNTSSDSTSGYGSLDPSGYDQAQWTLENQMMFDEMERAYNSAEAQKTRDWQEHMSNTAYQRAVKDLKEAGLNPWLALNGGSMNASSTPSGATASANSGSAKMPDSSIYRAHLTLIASLINSATNLLGKIGSAFIGG